MFPQSDLPNIFSDFFLNKIVKIQNDFGPQSPLSFLGNVSLETYFRPLNQSLKTLNKFEQNSPKDKRIEPYPHFSAHGMPGHCTTNLNLMIR